MSRSEVTKHIAKPLLKSLEKKARQVTRAEVQNQKGQLLILRDIKIFREIIKSSTGVSISKNSENEALAVAVAKAKSLQASFKSQHKDRYNSIVRRLPEVLPSSFVLGKNVFIVNSFASSIALVKTEIFKSLIKDGSLTEAEGKDAKTLIHRGHGVRGNAVSQVGIAKGMSKLGTLVGAGKQADTTLQENLGAYMMQGKIDLKQANEISALTLNYNQVVTTKGKLKTQYFSIIDFQSGKENSGVDSKMEKALVQAFRDYVKFIAPKLADIKGSSTLRQKVEKQLVSAIVGKKLYKNIRVTTPTRKYASSSKGTTRVKQKQKSSKPKITLLRASRIKKAKYTGKGVSASPLALIGALNKALPATIRANMGSPRLNYRSGAFANSVEVTNIITPARGYPIIDYTYAQEPYGVFELGNSHLASVERDPRNIIDDTIRELAALAAFRRFHTRRTF
jgi:hypothetical protein